MQKRNLLKSLAKIPEVSGLNTNAYPGSCLVGDTPIIW